MIYKKLGEIADLINGYSFKSENYVNKGLRVIRIANVQDGYLSDERPCFYPEKYLNVIGDAVLRQGDLLMSLTGNAGRVALLDKSFLPAVLNQRVECIRTRDEISKQYLFNYFRSNNFILKVTNATTGSAQQNLSIKWLENHEIPVVEIGEQEIINKTIASIDESISIENDRISYFDDLIKSRFIDRRARYGQC